MDSKTIRERIVVALRDLRRDDAHLLESNVSERAIAGRIQHYLVSLFPLHHVDTEYNRHGVEPKRVMRSAECRQHLAGKSLVVPDLLVHRRNTDAYNGLAVEIKKLGCDEEELECDRGKLRAIRHEFKYAASLLLRVPTGERSSEPFLLEWDGDGLQEAVA